MTLKRLLPALAMGAALWAIVLTALLRPGSPRPVAAAAAGAQDDGRTPVEREVPYVPTPTAIVERMIRLADVRKGDVVYDLGCGDGRIVIAAVQRPGVRGVCVDLDPVRILESRRNAGQAGVADRIRFVEGDLFDVSLEEASVVTLYLLPEVNLRLRPKLLAELRPGARIVSHAFDMGDWKPDHTVTEDGSVVYRWTVPAGGRAR